MKRIWILLAVVVLLLLLVGGAAWYFILGKARPEGPVTAADLIPSSSSVFLWLPHVPRSLENFKGTPAYKMWQEQAIQAALEKLNPLKQQDSPVPIPEEARKFWDLAGPLWSHFQGEAFIAVTTMQAEPKPKAEGIGGFQTGPDPAAFKAWTDQVKTSFPDLKWQEKTHPAQTYYVTEAGSGADKVTVCVAQWKDWVFVGLGEGSFTQLLDRVHAAEKDPATGLSGQSSYKKLLSQQPKSFDTLIYVNPAPFMELARKEMEKTSPDQLAMLKAYQSLDAVMLTSSIEGQNFRDRWIIQMPKDKRPDYGAAELPLKGTTARFTTANTLAYSAQNVDISKTLAQARDAGPDEKKSIDEGIAKINGALAGMQLDLEKDILPKLGPEFATILDWADGKSFPDFSLALEHKDPVMVKKITDYLVQMVAALGGGQLQIKNGDIAGDATYLFTFPMAPVAPAIWIGKDMLLVTINGAGLESMVARTGSGLLDTEGYKALAGRSEIKKPCSLAYADVEKLVSYGHGALSNLMPMLAGMAGKPELAQSLPPVDNLKPYLGRWMLLSEMNDQGATVEGLFDKGHPLIYGAVGVALVADIAKAVAPMAAMAAASAAPAADPAQNSQEGGAIASSLVLQDLVDLDDAITAWAKDKNQANGTAVTWNDVVPYLPENSQVATRVGLDPLGNAYVLGKVGEGQVTLAPETAKHFEGSVTGGFWGKFSPPAAAAAPQE